MFLDTPGHEAFTMMRARGAQVTDIVVLVVSAVDGVMPQTIEAINHAKQAEVPIIVAVNKVDLAEANVELVKRQLSEHGLTPEDWGGTTIYNEVSALKKTGIKELLESILLQAEILELEGQLQDPGIGNRPGVPRGHGPRHRGHRHPPEGHAHARGTRSSPASTQARSAQSSTTRERRSPRPRPRFPWRSSGSPASPTRATRSR